MGQRILTVSLDEAKPPFIHEEVVEAIVVVWGSRVRSVDGEPRPEPASARVLHDDLIDGEVRAFHLQLVEVRAHVHPSPRPDAELESHLLHFLRQRTQRARSLGAHANRVHARLLTGFRAVVWEALTRVRSNGRGGETHGVGHRSSELVQDRVELGLVVHGIAIRVHLPAHAPSPDDIVLIPQRSQLLRHDLSSGTCIGLVVRCRRV
mmetsp:Transcript_5864/g.11629  ORF Transcript_5864/g.11629 Transcript_5864/m.11629 type:complete len:207 (+) Transcript_5864:1198-1818(+)